MDRQPVLDGERLILRPLEERDWAAFRDAAGDPLIWEQHPAGDRWREAECRAWFEGALAEGALAVIDKATGKLVGSSRFQTLNLAPDASIIGSTFLARSHWGGETNREMKRLMLAHALAARPRAWFLVAEDNWRSRKAMEKIGGQLIERTFTADMPAGPVLHLIYEISREGFANGPLVKASGR